MYRCHSVKVLALTIDKNNAYILGICWLCSLSKKPNYYYTHMSLYFINMSVVF